LKKMVKTCIICGRRIKSGRKYCWQHRNNILSHRQKEYSNKEDRFIDYNTKVITTASLFFGVIIYLILDFINIFNLGINIFLSFAIPLIILVIYLIKRGKGYLSKNYEESNPFPIR
jgi:predicted nucleic acid-binding Zn ribbon protein